MRTSLNDIKNDDDYLQGKLSPGDSLFFQARMIVDPFQRMKVLMLKKVHVLVKMYGRNKLKSELDELHNRIFHHPEKRLFRQRIEKIFNEK